ncbi:MAG: ABC transporter permease [Planctomycetes bacterium]|nr:ABC transporter permease [Planctomycetota bacterium]
MIDFTAATTIWVRNLLLYKRTWKMNIFPNFFEPVFYLLSMGIGLGAYVAGVGEESYLAYIAPGLLASQAMMGASFETTYNTFVKMNFHRVYDAVLSTPAEVEDIVFGEMLWATTRAVAYGAGFLLVTALFGLVSTPLALLTLPAIVLVGILFGAIGLAFTARIPYIDLYSYYYTLFVTPMFLFSAVFYPLDRYPEWVRPLAALDPLYHSVVLMRGLFRGEIVPELAVHAAWCLVVSAIFYRLAVSGMKKKLIG